MVVIGDDKKATIKWDRDEEDNETKGVSNEVVLDLNLLSYVQIVRGGNGSRFTSIEREE